MPHTPTDEQSAAISAASAEGSLMISAYAGCAKSSTLEMMAPRIADASLALAFNKKIAQEIGARLPPNFQTKTLNALGHGAWSRRLGRGLKIVERKTGLLVTEIAKSAKVGLSSEQWDWTRQTVHKAMAAGLLPQAARFPEGQGLLQDSPEEWTNLAFEAGVPQDECDLVCDLARRVLIEDIEMALRGEISFDDQVYCPTVLGAPWAKFPTIMVDESQDLSPLNHRQLALSLRLGGRLIAVGDSRQAIYAFRGADAESMSNLRGLSEGWTDLPLTLTFRCPHEIVKRQQDHAPGFRAAPSNLRGRIVDLRESPDGWDLPQGALTVLCRNNAPLLSLAFKLLRNGIGCQMLGRDIGKGLQALLRKLTDPEDSADIVREKIQAWMDREVSLAEANGRAALADSVTDRGECLLTVLESGAPDARGLAALLEALFAKTAGQVTLSSIHRAKGLEWPQVLHLDPWRLPSKAAKRAGGSALEQEWNLKYVCETRTKEILLLANLEDLRI